MKLAVYNVENLFDRAKAMNLDTWEQGRPVLEKFAQLNELLGQIDYSAADKPRMAELMAALGLEKSDTGPFVLLRRNRNELARHVVYHTATALSSDTIGIILSYIVVNHSRGTIE